MNKLITLGCALVLASAVGCGSDDGATGPAGATGPDGSDGPEGPEGPEGSGGGTTGDPSLSAVLPGTAYLEHDVDVTISGFSTEWTSAATVDFGDDITVTNTNVASPTSIVATIEIAPGAAVGARDVTVTEGSDDVTYTGAFNVEEPLEAAHLGTAAQGSVLMGVAEQQDINAPFDELGASVAVMADGSSEGLVLDVVTYGLEYIAFLDVNATAEATDVIVESGLTDLVSSRAVDSIDVQARTATAITPGTPLTASYAGAFDSMLYSFDAAASQLVEVTMTSTGGDPLFFLLPSTGTFDDLMSLSDATAFTSTAQVETYYLVVFDVTGESGYDFTIDVTESATDEVEPNDACTSAQALTLPAALTNLTLSSDLDEDWFEITATATEVAMLIRAATSPGDLYTDTYIEFFESDCTTPLGPPSSDVDYHEDHTSGPITAAGTYYLRVTASPTLGTSQPRYDLDVDFAPCGVGAGTTEDERLPMELYYYYSYAQSIYLSTELCGADSIQTIGWEYNGYTASTEDIVIYLGHTTKGDFTSTTDWIAVGSMTQVYAGTLPLTTTAGWTTVTLDTPFAYNGTDNLVVAVDRNTGNYTSVFADFYVESTPNVDRSITHHNDTVNADPATPPAGILRPYIANAQFE